MKNIYLSLIIIICISACSQSKKAFRNADYAGAVFYSTKKVQHNKKKYKEVDMLEKSFAIANKKDLENIAFLKNQNKPADVEKIFTTYHAIRTRQERIKYLLPLYNKLQNRNAVFEFTDVDKEMLMSKNATIDYFYNKGKVYLAKQNRFDAREAYTMFETVAKLDKDYKDIQQLMNDAYADGQNYVFVKMINDARVVLPQDFETDLLSITTGDLKTHWTRYDTRKRDGIQYSHNIIIRLKNIDVSPERELQREYTEEKTIKEKVVLKDKNGKILKDSTGKEISEIQTFVIKCNVTEVEQNKGANVSGTIEFYDKESNQLLKKMPVNSTMLWQHFAAKSSGDERALKETTKNKLGNRPVSFPNDLFILSGAGENLKPQVKDIIANYFSLVK